MKIITWDLNFNPSSRIASGVLTLPYVVGNSSPFFHVNGYLLKCCRLISRHAESRFQDCYVLWFLKKFRFDKHERIVFMVNPYWHDVFFRTGYIDALKKRYSDSKFVLTITDIHRFRKLHIDELKMVYDDIIVYDKEEADKLGISYFPPKCTKVYDIPNNIQEEYDLFFVGHAKNRLDEIQAVVAFLSSKGMKCFCYVTGVERERRIDIDGIIYADEVMSYADMFDYLSHSKCVLELELFESHAPTARAREAIMYDKKILTNNKTMLNDPFYSSDMIQVYSDVNEIDIGFWDRPKISYGYNGEYDPIDFMEYVRKVMSE